MNQWAELISELDKTLCSLVRLWEDPDSTHCTDRVMTSINQALDQRLAVMAKRDMETRKINYENS